MIVPVDSYGLSSNSEQYLSRIFYASGAVLSTRAQSESNLIPNT